MSERLTQLERQDLYDILQRGDELDSYTNTTEKALRLIDCGELLADAKKQRDAWRKAARLMYGVMTEGGRKGRPMDVCSKQEWADIIKAIGDADATEAI